MRASKKIRKYQKIGETFLVFQGTIYSGVIAPQRAMGELIEFPLKSSESGKAFHYKLNLLKIQVILVFCFIFLRQIWLVMCFQEFVELVCLAHMAPNSSLVSFQEIDRRTWTCSFFRSSASYLHFFFLLANHVRRKNFINLLQERLLIFLQFLVSQSVDFNFVMSLEFNSYLLEFLKINFYVCEKQRHREVIHPVSSLPSLHQPGVCQVKARDQEFKTDAL